MRAEPHVNYIPRVVGGPIYIRQISSRLSFPEEPDQWGDRGNSYRCSYRTISIKEAASDREVIVLSPEMPFLLDGRDYILPAELSGDLGFVASRSYAEARDFRASQMKVMKRLAKDMLRE